MRFRFFVYILFVLGARGKSNVYIFATYISSHFHLFRYRFWDSLISFCNYYPLLVSQIETLLLVQIPFLNCAEQPRVLKGIVSKGLEQLETQILDSPKYSGTMAFDYQFIIVVRSKD